MTIIVQHLTGSKQGMTESFTTQSLSIGRDPSNDLAFDPSVDIDVSSRHAQLNFVPGGGFQLVDLGSTNGSFVNGQKVTGSAMVPNGSLIELGKNGPRIQVRFQEPMGMQPMGGMPMQPGMAQPHPGMMPVGAVGGPPQKGARTRMFEQAIEKSQQEAKSTKKLLCCSVVGFLGVIVLGIGIFFYLSWEAMAKRATLAKKGAEDAQTLAKDVDAEDYPESKSHWDQALAYVKEGDQHFDAWDYEAAEESYGRAEKMFGKAGTEAEKQETYAKLAEREKQAEKRLSQIESDREKYEASYNEELKELSAAKSGADEEVLKELERKEKELVASHKETLDEFANKTEAVKSGGDKLKQLAAQNHYVVCRLESEVWFYANEKPVAKINDSPIVGTGVFIQGEKILTAKSVVKPQLYDLKLKALSDYYEAQPNTRVRVRTRAYIYAPVAADQGQSKDWMLVFDTEDASMTPAKEGLEAAAEYQEGQTITVDINKNSKRMDGVKILKDNHNNWATFDLNFSQAFPPTPEGRDKRRKIHGDFSLQYQTLAKTPFGPLDEALQIGVEGAVIKMYSGKVQGESDPFGLDEGFKPDFRGAPVFNEAGELAGIIVRHTAPPGFEMEGISSIHIKP